MTPQRLSDNAGDTWDITTGLGATALGVAAYRAAESVQESPLVRDGFATVLVDSVGVPGWQRLARADTSWLDSDDERGRRTLSASRDFVAARTVYFDRYFADSVASGISQVVILAAGLDARSYRLDCLADCIVFELDQPKVLEYKLATLAAHGSAPKGALRQWRLTCERTGRPPSPKPGSTERSARRGWQKACCHTCRRRASGRWWATSPR